MAEPRSEMKLGAAGRSYALDRPGNGRGRGHRAQVQRYWPRAPYRGLAASRRPSAHAIRRFGKEPDPGARRSRGPLKRGTMTLKRHGTTTLFAALNVLDGTVFGRCMQRHRHQEFPASWAPSSRAGRQARRARQRRNAQDARGHALAHPASPLGVPLHADLRLLAVETLFSALTRRRLRRGVFRSVADLQAAINRYLKEHNNDPNPFVWTKSADNILAKTCRLPEPSQ